jgi:hypothetical protein
VSDTGVLREEKGKDVFIDHKGRRGESERARGRWPLKGMRKSGESVGRGM